MDRPPAPAYRLQSLDTPEEGPIRWLPVVLALSALALSGCGPAHSVRPLGSGRNAFDFSMGGPMAHLGGFGGPMPTAQLGYTRGLTDTTDAFARLQLTSALFGIFAAEAGASHQLFSQQGWLPALSLSLDASLTAGLGAGNAVLVPAGGLVASWLPWDPLLLYLGASAGASVSMIGEARWGGHFAPYFGFYFLPGGSNWAIGSELRWYAPTRANTYLTVPWIGVGKWGALAPIFVVSRSFGGGP